MDIAHLEYLIETNNKSEISILLNRYPQLASQKTSHGASPTLLACYYKKPEIAMLIAEYTPEITIYEACALGKFDTAKQILTQNFDLLNAFSNDGFTPLGLAAYFGHENICKLLVVNGAEVNTPTNNGFNVYPLHSAVAARSYNIAKLLLDAGAEVNVRQQAGFTPLHAAAQYGDIEIIILLLENNADVEIEMEGGKLASDLALEKGFLEIADILKA